MLKNTEIMSAKKTQNDHVKEHHNENITSSSESVTVLYKDSNIIEFKKDLLKRIAKLNQIIDILNGKIKKLERSAEIKEFVRNINQHYEQTRRSK